MRYYLTPVVFYDNEGTSVRSSKIREYTDDWTARSHLYNGSTVIVGWSDAGMRANYIENASHVVRESELQAGATEQEADAAVAAALPGIEQDADDAVAAALAGISSDPDITFLWEDDADYDGLAQGLGNGTGLPMAQIAQLNGLLASRGIMLNPSDTRQQIRQKVLGA